MFVSGFTLLCLINMNKIVLFLCSCHGSRDRVFTKRLVLCYRVDDTTRHARIAGPNNNTNLCFKCCA